MNIQQYTLAASRTCPELSSLHKLESNQNLELIDNLHLTTGMVTEVGELVDVFKKNLAYNKRIDWMNVEEEIGDLLWYTANFCRINGLDLGEIMQKNIRKLQVRYPDKFTGEAAINRDVAAERIELEK